MVQAPDASLYKSIRLRTRPVAFPFPDRQVGELTESVTKRGMEALATALPDSVANRLQMSASSNGPCTAIDDLVSPPLSLRTGSCPVDSELGRGRHMVYYKQKPKQKMALAPLSGAAQRSGRACARCSASTRWRATRS